MHLCNDDDEKENNDYGENYDEDGDDGDKEED